MQNLNVRVDVDGESPHEVARSFLQSADVISLPGSISGWYPDTCQVNSFNDPWN